jgi:hypothetical protein
MGTSPPPTRDGAPPAEELDCPRCGAPYEPLQEYCLECGLRLPGTGGVVESLRTGWMRRWAWYPGDWIWVVLLSLVVAAVGAALAILLSHPDHGTHTLVATSRLTSAPPATEQPTITTGTLPTEPTTTERNTTTQATRPKPPRNGVVTWPAGRSGYTVVLNSLPTGNGRAAALAQARQAASRGLEQVGVLDSGRYASLHPGYYVVFSGIYSSLGAAQAAVSGARAAGYGAAYARQITT